jgi:2-oxoglutarate ferredoxin oxidoreductase subunit beta
VASITKPIARHPSMERNSLGLTIRDYEGGMSTLCAGCGHDSVTAALVRTFWELSTPPHMLAKMSGIGCSGKTPAYFVGGAHGLNGAHGRMAAIATGAKAANRALLCVGISGDGDSLSIGLGHLSHAIRRNVPIVYVIENNGVYGLTKGQFSASADVGSRPKKGEPNRMAPIDPILLGLSLGATFLARSFSGDKQQLVPILKAAVAHQGFALIDVISPCVTFNDHEGSTKSYLFTREHAVKAGVADFVPPEEEIVAAIPGDGVRSVRMHDGSEVRFRSVPGDYDPTDRASVAGYLEQKHSDGEVVTGLLYLNESVPDLHALSGTSPRPLVQLPHAELCPGSAQLDALQESFR